MGLDPHHRVLIGGTVTSDGLTEGAVLTVGAPMGTFSLHVQFFSLLQALVCTRCEGLTHGVWLVDALCFRYNDNSNCF